MMNAKANEKADCIGNKSVFVKKTVIFFLIISALNLVTNVSANEKTNEIQNVNLKLRHQLDNLISSASDEIEKEKTLTKKVFLVKNLGEDLKRFYDSNFNLFDTDLRIDVISVMNHVEDIPLLDENDTGFCPEYKQMYLYSIGAENRSQLQNLAQGVSKNPYPLMIYKILENICR